ncbi:MAG: hypothetical protein LBQ12_14245 [Deltaproteobacteria bacterium]|nr:hypothetical protein [Deltaproteobacteria bacterium]
MSPLRPPWGFADGAPSGNTDTVLNAGPELGMVRAGSGPTGLWTGGAAGAPTYTGGGYIRFSSSGVNLVPEKLDPTRISSPLGEGFFSKGIAIYQYPDHGRSPDS